MWQNIKSRAKFQRGDIIRPKYNEYPTYMRLDEGWNRVISYYAYYIDVNMKTHRVHIDKLKVEDIEYFGGWFIRVRKLEDGAYSMESEESMEGLENSYMPEKIIRDIKLKNLML